jgi:xylulokinase
MRYILAHDLGTSGNKATLFSEEGKLIGSTVYAYDTAYFNETWAEQDPADWWRAVCETSRALIAETGIANTDIAVVSFSGQMMGCLCVDRKGNPLRKSIIWADQRAQTQQRALGEHITLRDFYQIVGHRNSASYGLQKLMWVRDNQPEIYEATYKTLNAKDYIVFKLTGNFYTEPSDASSNTCMDLKSLNWSERLIEYAGVDGDKFPKIVPSTFVAGGVTKEAALATGLAEGTKVVMGGGDGACANVGAGSVKPGKSFSYVGSSAWIATTSEKPLFDEGMRTFTWAHIVPGMYAPNGTMQSAGGAYAWLKNQVCKFESFEAQRLGVSPYQLIDAEIAESPAGSNGVVFLPYLLGERAPRWSVDARGAFIGLKMENQRRDMLRSVLEGVTMNLAIILDILRQYIPIDEILVIGGGAKGAVWRQMMADIYDVRILAPALLEEATSMGAAVAGGVGAGLFKDFDAIDRFIEVKYVSEPIRKNVEAYKPVRETFDLCYQSLQPVYQKMANH